MDSPLPDGDASTSPSHPSQSIELSAGEKHVGLVPLNVTTVVYSLVPRHLMKGGRGLGTRIHVGHIQ